MVLNSWKEISAYVGRSVRTVQRWEAELGLPIRRPRGRSRSPVIAMSDEIDAWLRSAPAVQEIRNGEVESELLQCLRRGIREHSDLQLRCQQLCNDNKRLLSDFRSTLHDLADEITRSRNSLLDIAS